MSTTIFNLRSYVNGDAIDLDSLKFQDSTGTYGLKRTDTGAVVIASGVDLTRLSEGVYQYVLTDPAADLIYDYWIRITYAAGFSGAKFYQRTTESTVTVSHVFSVPVQTHYSSEAEVMRFLGELAADLMTEDWESADKSPVWSDILSYVDETIDMILGQKYERAAILTSPYVRRRATILATHLLTMRRGNPPLYKVMHDQILDEFNDITTGKRFIPNAIPFSRNAPVVRNYQMQPFLHHPKRTVLTKSTGAAYPGMDIAWEPYLFVWN